MILKEERKNQAIWVSFKGPFPRPSPATPSESLILAPEQRLCRVLRGQGDDGI